MTARPSSAGMMPADFAVWPRRIFRYRLPKNSRALYTIQSIPEPSRWRTYSKNRVYGELIRRLAFFWLSYAHGRCFFFAVSKAPLIGQIDVTGTDAEHENLRRSLPF
jgi:hypothetical protein